MKKKLWALNLLLIVGLGLLARELRQDWRAAREREQKVLNKPVKPAAAPVVAQQPQPPPLQASGYIDVAQQMLFSKDRNPSIVIEPVQPKPTPAFPRFYGVMNLGDGNTAILGDAPGRQRPFQVGDKVGEFKLAEIGKDTLTFEWEEKKFVKRFSEMQERVESAAVETTRASQPASAPPPAPKPVEPARAGPGLDTGGGISAWNANDPSPAGTVMDGKRKVVSETPFGKVCRWEAVTAR
ncbi:MAG TPA: hypothetical protein VM120_06580 [Bryobacteraceae bacterium]|nr:hypothetical protein [Bryobacteraceae bacterium]